MRARITSELPGQKNNRRRLRRLLERSMRTLGVPERCEVSVSLVGEGTITELNEKYMGRSGPTDVLAFPLHDGAELSRLAGDGRPDSLGDIVICVHVAARQAGEGKEREELELLAVHGLLHLLGHDDAGAEGAIEMAGMESELLGRTIKTE